uniref:Natriuretic peptides B n=1 Tax=Bos indicus x Bos taurus TaxID=30522 RepID=A0A4W2I572_BOBOX
MDPQTALSRALLLLLFLHLSLLGCRSHPVGGPGPVSELPGLQELLDRLRDRVSELQAEQLRVEPLQQGQGLEETWDSPAAAPAGFLGPHHSILRALRGPKMMRDSGCFGRRLDRIGSLSGLGCNGEHLSPFQLHIIRATSGSDVSGDQILNKEHHSSLLAVLRAKACLSGNIKFGQHSLSCLGAPSIHLLPLTERGRITLGCNSVTIQQALLGAENS